MLLKSFINFKEFSDRILDLIYNILSFANGNNLNSFPTCIPYFLSSANYSD